MSTVVFEPDGQTIEAPTGARLLGLVLQAGRPIGYACRGRGVCVACRLWVSGPQSPIDPEEAALLAKVSPPHARGEARLRIACLARVEGDVRVRASYW